MKVVAGTADIDAVDIAVEVKAAADSMTAVDNEAVDIVVEKPVHIVIVVDKAEMIYVVVDMASRLEC
jgi:hypothetical protein